MSQHQLAEAVQLRLSKAAGIGVVQNVGTVFVILAVGNMAANFVHFCGPAQLALETGHDGFGRTAVTQQLAKQHAGNGTHALGLFIVHLKFGDQLLHRGRAQVGLLLVALYQVIKHAMAQGTIGGMHFINLKQIKHGAQHAQAPAYHQAAVVLHAVDAQAVHMLCLDQPVSQPIEPGDVDQAGRPAGRSEHVADRPNGARRPIGHVPGIGSVNIQGLVEHRLGGNFSHPKGVGGELTIGEILHGPSHTAQPE